MYQKRLTVVPSEKQRFPIGRSRFHCLRTQRQATRDVPSRDQRLVFLRDGSSCMIAVESGVDEVSLKESK